jgi:hypothetical protein
MDFQSTLYPIHMSHHRQEIWKIMKCEQEKEMDNWWCFTSSHLMISMVTSLYECTIEIFLSLEHIHNSLPMCPNTQQFGMPTYRCKISLSLKESSPSSLPHDLHMFRFVTMFTFCALRWVKLIFFSPNLCYKNLGNFFPTK